MIQDKVRHDNADLSKLYTDGEEIDSKVFAEQRSNLHVIAGDQYNKKKSVVYERLRAEKDLSEQTKLRLVKNHTQYCTDLITNTIISAAPDVGFRPANENELADQKKAEMHRSVYLDAKYRYDLDDLTEEWAQDYVDIGEVVTKIAWDPNGGEVKGYSQRVDDDQNPLFIGVDGQLTPEPIDAWGRQHPMAPDWNAPVFTGAFVFEKVYGFNLLRPAECKGDLNKAAWLCIRKMVDKDVLTAMVGNDPEKLKFIKDTEDKTFLVWDGAGFRAQGKGEVLVREFYFRPCHKYPRGYFFITTLEGILFEGELPGGIFPIVYRAYKRSQNSPRGYGPVRALRTYQIEINRAASKIAEHQMTVGDDKIITKNGSKVSAGIALPGIRHVSVTGSDPTVLPGRDGSQFVAYMVGQIEEMYQVAGLKEELEELPAQLDPMVLMFRAARQKKRFRKVIRGFEKFLINVAKTYLALAKVHLPDDQVIKAVGVDETVNIAEFKSADNLGYEIHVEAQSEDAETKIGRQLVLNNALQYVGGKLEREDVGTILSLMPFGNVEGAFKKFTQKRQLATNLILALDRGDQPPIGRYDDHDTMIEELSFRMSQPSFHLLPPHVQQNYEMRISTHEDVKAKQLLEVQRAQQGFIPTSGYMVTTDFYVPDPQDPLKQKRLRVPASALDWLVKHLEAQGEAVDQLYERVPRGVQAEVAHRIPQAPNLLEGMVA